MILSNHFLVAMPSAQTDLFTNSVVYITEHSNVSGTVGVIINKPLGKTLKSAFQDIDLSEYNPKWGENPLYLGGPISSDNGFVLHRLIDTPGKLFELTNNKNVLDEIATSNFRDNLFVSAGYCSWSALQLENEIVNNHWLVVKADTSLIFDVDPLNRYIEALKLAGIRDISRLYCGGEVFA